MNVFLVAINAEIRFRRYFKMIQQDPPTTALPEDVHALMHRVIDLVNVLYWVPVPTEGSKGEAIRAKLAPQKCKNPERAGRSSQPQYAEATSGEESPPTPTQAWKSSKRSRGVDWLAFANLEERKAYGTALMSGHGIPPFHLCDL